MKKIFSLTLVILLIFVTGIMTFADEYDRENADLPTIGEPTAIISEITNWKLDKSTGQWKSTDNSDQFASIARVPVSIDGTDYIGLIFYSQQGAYRYPHIKAGFYVYTASIMYVLNKEQIAQLMIEDNAKTEARLVRLKPIYICNEGSAKLKAEIKKGVNKRCDLIFNILPMKEKGVVRFNILRRDGIIGGLQSVGGGFIWEGKKLLLPDTFKERYNEVTFDTFGNFFSTN